MDSQFAAFRLPLHPEAPEAEVLNSFLRSHSIIRCQTNFLADNGGAWAVLVEYAARGKSETRQNARVDWKAVLSNEEFAWYDRLRQVRKTLAEQEGFPAYAICTNEQLASFNETLRLVVARHLCY